MEKEFLDKVEDNAVVRIWAETTQQEKGDSLTEGCFTFGKLDLVPTVEEYTTLLRCPKIQIDKWVAARINQKGDSKCIPWRNLKDLILAFPDVKKRLDVFALSIYGLVIFLKALGHIDEAVSDLFD
ncbi:hypothetical protein Goklo_016464 [Gossypium klotzschianum]|uniref:Uncharacterized protein n=1 Tax=Gossypium klotzschianum TaxID=34286 RepID=A0A7J8UEE9_9ROSI|nr:hypothetical protein [Gossypium klotzschianum]